MQAPVISKCSSQITKWKPYKSWKYNRDLLRSIPQMSPEELDINLVEINLCAYYNTDVLEMLDNKMVDLGFYLRNRHILENLVNTDNREKGLSEKIVSIAKRFDYVFVNGLLVAQKIEQGQKQNEQAEESTSTKQNFSNQNIDSSQGQSKIIKAIQAQQKQTKAKFIEQRQKVILRLSNISDKLFQCKQGKNEEEIQQNKRKIFTQSLTDLNNILREFSQNSSLNSLSQNFEKKVKLESDQLEQEKILKKVTTSPFVLVYKRKLYPIFQISIQKSCFIPTKNRNPLKLDFGFGQFIYKNDDQLAHQIIAMQFIKYLNKIFCTQYIQEYEIIPEVRGAFYEFVQAKTLAQVKKQHQDLSNYFKVLSETNQTQITSIQKRFAESYAGYCIAEFMLEIKDRNNANIMIKEDGTFFHIDLAFIFNAKPGGISFESAPFKMTKQYLKAMGGFDSDNFKYFESLLIQVLTKIYESKEEFLCKLDILSSRSKEIRCFNGFDIQKYRNLKILKSLEDARSFVQNLIDESFDNWRTKKYDTYQWKTNKIPA